MPNPGRSAPQNPQMASASARTNDYFVPRDGIDREVIQSDICRYLGRDALVRPGSYEGPDGRVVQGYFITAYRNLTSAMIQDLKADSIRWENEKRAASRAAGSGAGGARQPTSYSDWKSHQDNTTNTDFDAYAGGPGAMDLDSYGSQNFAPQAGATSYTTQPTYTTAPQAYGNAAFPAYSQTPLAYSAAPGTAGGYVSAGPPMGSSYTDQSYLPGANYQTPGAPAFPAGSQASRLPPVTSTASRATYPTTGASGYEDDYYSPPDPVWGRVTTQGRSGYNTVQDQYDAMSMPSMSTTTGPAGASPVPIPGQPSRRETDSGHRRERSDRDDRRRHR